MPAEKVLLIFPHQLFDPDLVKEVADTVFLIEDPLFFKDTYHGLKFHKQKLIFHRASMKAYEDELTRAGVRVDYIPYTETNRKGRECAYLAPHLEKGKEYYYYSTEDYILEKRLRALEKNQQIAFTVLPSPNFFLTESEVRNLLPKVPHRLTPFYVALRKRYNYLMEHGKPLGGKWTYDTENRKKIPKGLEVKEALRAYENSYIQEAKEYSKEHFHDAYGQGETFYYAVTRGEAQKVFELFLWDRFKSFGPYEDAIVKDRHVLFHSTISAYLNIGLLSPQAVVEQAIAYGERAEVPLQSVEGFVRQILGWREFIRGVYIVSGGEMRKKNFFGYTRRAPESIWKGDNGIPPLDSSIAKALETAYLHHIERLMIMGNYMLLEEYCPDDVYRWFMELFIDAYDWVMVPNVYGMITYSDGGMITTKPYVSGANYILKMSDYVEGEWSASWTKKYWDFVTKHSAIFEKNPRMQMLIKRHGNQ